MPRLALYSLALCVLAVAAAVLSFAKGTWFGIVWVLIAGLSSNMTWYYFRRGRAGTAAGTSGGADRPAAG